MATPTLIRREIRNMNLSLGDVSKSELQFYSVGNILITDLKFCKYLGIRRQIGDGHFERFQDSHGPRCSVVKHIPHTRLQQMRLSGCLGNGHTHLNEWDFYLLDVF